MGLFGGGNSSSSNTSNTSTEINDSRVGVSDNASYVGSGASVTNTITNNSITSDPAVLQKVAEMTGAIATGAFTASHDLMKEATRLSGDALDKNQRVSSDAIAAAEASARRSIEAANENLYNSLEAVRRNASDAYSFAQSVNDGFLHATRDLNNLVSDEGSNNRSFATGLVDQVLARSQSADQQNYEKTLDMLKWIAAAAAVAIAIPFIFKKGVRV